MPLRLGILGAANIVPNAIISPARKIPEVQVVAIAARDPERARAFARKHHIPRVIESYDVLLADPEIDAIYNPLPNSLHAPWTIKALAAGKHVLCEKPFASNAAEAEQMAEAAQTNGRVLMEAFHYRYHPLASRMRAIVTSGELGTITHVAGWMCFPLLSRRDIRYNFALGGGATMDAGSYGVNVLRFLTGGEPEVIAAKAKLSSPQVDRRMDVDLRFPNDVTGHMTCSLLSTTILRIEARVTGTLGEMRVTNFIAPHIFHRLTVRTAQAKRSEHVSGSATYTYQLRAFAKAVNEGAPTLSDPQDAIANMRVIDAIYQHAGLSLRGN